MIDESTKEKLKRLKIDEMIDSLEDLNITLYSAEISFDEKFKYLIDDTYQRKHNNTVKHLIKSAHFRYPADITDLKDIEKRGVNKNMITELASCNFIRSNITLIIKGPVSSGKTWLACALGKQACKIEYRTLYIRTPDLFEKIKIYGRQKMVTKLSKYPLLILDEWLLYKMSDDEARFILELLERRYDSKATILATLFDPKEWYGQIDSSATTVESILERTIRNCIQISLSDFNMRQSQ